MPVNHEVVKLRIKNSKVNGNDPDPVSFEEQFQNALSEQTASGTLNWSIVKVIEGSVSSLYSDYFIIFEDKT